jgi:hypothetical protein
VDRRYLRSNQAQRDRGGNVQHHVCQHRHDVHVLRRRAHRLDADRERAFLKKPRFVLALVVFALSFGAAAQSFPDLDQLEGKLGIRPDQKQQYDKTIDATKRALIAAGIAAVQSKDDISRELARKDPDYTSLVLRQKARIEQQKPYFDEAGREWEKFFKQLDDRQLRIAKAWVHENLGRLFP